jgi:D-alanyl-D-alanine carboxypeptidase
MNRVFAILLMVLNHIAYGQTMNKTGMEEEKLQHVLDKTVDNKKVFGTVVNVSSGSESWIGSAGNLTNQSQYFIASTTKLYITAIILKLRETGQLSLDDKISAYLPSNLMNDLHIYKRVDYSDEITIKHLLSHTSGLPDYFEQKKENGQSLKDELISGEDQRWIFEETITISKKMKPHFKPGQKGKAHYSDTNYQLLGKIIEIVTDMTISQALAKYVFKPLGLEKTYLYQDSNDTVPATVYYKTEPLPIPMAMTSFGPDGGIVSTASESMVFLKAFFNGKLFPKEYLDEMKDWNKIFFPLQYGIGIARFKLPRIFLPFKPVPELIGHSGLSGAFAYYCPEKDIYFTGTVNQIHNPGLSYKLMIRILNNI